MVKTHTHYDNLKVTRNAPPEVIRAAYKTLTQKYHPDRHPGNTDAERVMSLINVSYQVLSDPVQRAAHDIWIDQQDAMTAASEPGVSRSATSSQGAQASSQTRTHYQASPMPSPSRSASNSTNGLIAHVLRNWLLYGVAGLFIWLWTTEDKPAAPRIGPKPYQAAQPTQAEQVPAPIENVKPLIPPNGQLWPSAAGYVEGYQQLNTNGLSTVTVDNSRNDSDVFVKLVSLDGAQAFPVRQFYIPAFASFTLKKVTAGSYDIRYRDLVTGSLSRSEAITLSEVHTDEGAQYSNITMTLYKVKNGNMKTYGLSETEF